MSGDEVKRLVRAAICPHEGSYALAEKARAALAPCAVLTREEAARFTSFLRRFFTFNERAVRNEALSLYALLTPDDVEGAP